MKSRPRGSKLFFGVPGQILVSIFGNFLFLEILSKFGDISNFVDFWSKIDTLRQFAKCCRGGPTFCRLGGAISPRGSPAAAPPKLGAYSREAALLTALVFRDL